MTISLSSPNVDNYVVGKGKVYFQPEGAPGTILDYDVGNVTEFEFSPELEKLDHFSQREGVRSKDKSIVLEKSATARLILEEWTPSNLSMFLLGTVDDADVSAVTIDIFAENTLRGHLRYVGQNDIGPKWTFDFPVVEFSPEGSLNPISDDWAGIEVTGEVIFDSGTFGTASADFSDDSAPVNTVLPSISGIAQQGVLLTANNGEWTGHPATYSYQWQTDNGAGWVNLAGATSKTYTPVAGDVGDPLRVIVTAVNGSGSTAATSAATVDTLAP